MDETKAPTAGRRPNAREAKRAVRAAHASHSIPYITRKIPCYEVLGEEGLALIEVLGHVRHLQHAWIEGQVSPADGAEPETQCAQQERAG